MQDQISTSISGIIACNHEHSELIPSQIFHVYLVLLVMNRKRKKESRSEQAIKTQFHFFPLLHLHRVLGYNGEAQSWKGEETGPE